jgi:hypothetical protein
MRVFGYADRAIGTDLDLGGLLPERSTGAPDIVAQIGPVTLPAGERLLYEITDVKGFTEARVWRVSGGYILHVLGRARVHVEVGPLPSITIDPVRRAAAATIRSLLLDYLVPRLLGLLGEVVVHATCVATSAGSLAFLGDSGFGKSTLAVSFALQGHPLQADDCLVLRTGEGVTVLPSYPATRLRGPSVQTLLGMTSPSAGHHLLSAADGLVPFSSTPTPLRGLFLLNDPTAAAGDTVSARLVPPLKAAMWLLVNAFHLDTGGRSTNRSLLDRFCTLTELIPAYALTYPRRPESLAEVRRTVLELVSDPDDATPSR